VKGASIHEKCAQREIGTRGREPRLLSH
jgi:hypothetical protein